MGTALEDSQHRNEIVDDRKQHPSGWQHAPTPGMEK
jgi:hypothetical protein